MKKTTTINLHELAYLTNSPLEGGSQLHTNLCRIMAREVQRVVNRPLPRCRQEKEDGDERKKWKLNIHVRLNVRFLEHERLQRLLPLLTFYTCFNKVILKL